jgi:DNA-binding NarL/FixJ family response regulator
MSTPRPEAPIRVALVDDDSRVVDAFTALLATYPELEVVGTAHDGEAAVAMALACRPDVIVMDVIMPGLDGIGATRRLKQQLPSARIVLLTTYGAVERDAVAAGADAMLLKVDSDEEIVDTILRLAHRRPALREV